MSQKKNGTADDMRTLALLWGSHTEPGRSGLTVKAIVTTALAIADGDGLDALSMRKVAEQLDVGTMSLYTHVPSKDELIQLMIDTVYGELYDSVDTPAQQPGNWQDALRFIAQRNWGLLLAHPWILQVNTSRPVLGPHGALKYEAELRPLDSMGLSDVEMDAVLTLILSHTEGCARAQVARKITQRETGATDAEWWVTTAPLVEKLIDPAHFPVATRVGLAAGQAHQAAFDPEFTFKFGLERILAGVAALITTKGDG